MRIARFIGIVTGVWLVYHLASAGETPWLEHVAQARGWLNGHWWFDGAVSEQIPFRGHFYSVHPPLSAAIMFIALLLHWPYETSICITLGAVTVGVVDLLFGNLWLTAFFAFGTNFGWCAMDGGPWGMTLLVGCLMTFVALLAMRHDAPLAVGVFGGLAGLARYDLVAALPLYMVLLGRRCCWFLFGLIPAFEFYLINAYDKWGMWFDDSMWRWWQVDHVRAPLTTVGPFSLAYLPQGIYTSFFMTPDFSWHFPWIRPNARGMSLLVTSPALLLALRAPLRDRENLLLWLTTLGVMAGALCVYLNGWVQLGARYWLLAMPFLIALMSKTPMDQFAKIMIGASIVLMSYYVWCVRIYSWN